MAGGSLVGQEGVIHPLSDHLINPQRRAKESNAAYCFLQTEVVHSEHGASTPLMRGNCWFFFWLDFVHKLHCMLELLGQVEDIYWIIIESIYTLVSSCDWKYICTYQKLGKCMRKEFNYKLLCVTLKKNVACVSQTKMYPRYVKYMV